MPNAAGSTASTTADFTASEHPGHAVATAQQSAPDPEAEPGAEGAAAAERMYGGMLSIRVRGGKASALGVVRRLRLWMAATSLGGVESLIEHRYSIEGAGVPEDLLRLSVGCEDWRDLLADLTRALDQAEAP